jgi:hypothetical protein
VGPSALNVHARDYLLRLLIMSLKKFEVTTKQCFFLPRK